MPPSMPGGGSMPRLRRSILSCIRTRFTSSTVIATTFLVIVAAAGHAAGASVVSFESSPAKVGRGGGRAVSVAAGGGTDDGDAYDLLASAISPRMRLLDEAESSSSAGPSPHPLPPADEYVRSISRALRSMSAAQSTLKGLDGAAHEAYQRTHRGGRSEQVASKRDDSVSGRAARSAARAGCAADAFLAAELCELAARPDLNSEEHAAGVNGTLRGREVLLNATTTVSMSDHGVDGDHRRDDVVTLTVLVLYEADYNGGAGLGHGGIDDLLLSNDDGDPTGRTGGSRRDPTRRRGRLLIVVGDDRSGNLPATVRCLDSSPRPVALSTGLVTEAASVHDGCWRGAGAVLELARPALLSHGDGGTSTNSTNNNATAETPPPGSEATPLPPAIHLVGRSLAGGVAGLAAAILDGSLPMPPDTSGTGHGRKGRRRRNKNRSSGGGSKGSKVTAGGISRGGGSEDPSLRSKSAAPKKRRRHRSGSAAADSSKEMDGEEGGDLSNAEAPVERDDGSSRGKEVGANDPEDVDDSPSAEPVSLQGFGRGRTSAVALGPPPCLSPNVRAAFVTSVVYGDDVVSRTTQGGLDRLCRRCRRTMRGGILGRRVGWMTDAVSLTVSSLKSHAHGSEGEETRLAVPGMGYLVRPRRLGGVCSMHEIGGTPGGREALRAAVLWQLNDVLLSRSLWAHHALPSYIRGLDRVQLRSFADDDDVDGFDDYGEG